MIPTILKYTTAKGPRRWGLWLAITCMVAISLGVLYWVMRKQRQKIASLRVEVEAANVATANARYEIIKTLDRDRLEVLMGEVRFLQITADTKKQKLVDAEKTLLADLDKVKDLKSWKSLDTHNLQERS